MSKIRETLAPSEKKPAASKTGGKSSSKSSSRNEGGQGRRRDKPRSDDSRASRPRGERRREERDGSRDREPRPQPSGSDAGKRSGTSGASGARSASGSLGARGSRDGGRSTSRSSRAGAPRAPQGERYEPPLRSGPRKHTTDVPPQDTAFSKLGLNDRIACAVAQKGYTEPTPIQAQAIPLVLAGRDVAGSAQTGTGKTAAFALPILQRLGAHGRLRCLVLEPTRELALQVEEAFNKYSQFTDLDVTIVYGGVGYGRQRDDLARGVDILAATPGRLLDHMEQGTVSLDHIEVLVLDEVDRMLDMGFLPDVKRIVQKCPRERQTLFFTATLPPEITQLAAWALRDPVEVKIGRQRTPAETVSHAFYPVVVSQKPDLLDELLKRTDFHSVIIFSRTKFGADRIARRLARAGHTVGVLHSDRNQRERTEALAGFKSGKYEVLVATDIAARGLDIADVSHVINYDVPENPEDYVHRIGRTGRAQKTGEAFTIVTEDDVRDARSIERFIGAGIERKKLDGFDYIYSALFDENARQDAAPKPVSRLHRGLRR
ncbi:MAG: DEAD/DEAH box helicase [Opitutaceae bacterium]|nr:DEAD/DEAH box helicase [Opitutaceae bacterium]